MEGRTRGDQVADAGSRMRGAAEAAVSPDILEEVLRRQDLAMELLRTAAEQLRITVGDGRCGSRRRTVVAPRAPRQSQVVLTSRQREIVELIACGLSNGQIAWRLGLSEKTVKNHVSAILARLRLPDRTAVAVHAIVTGLATGPA